MRQVEARRNHLLLHDDGSINYPFSKFLTDKFSNPHTRELAAQSLRVFYRFCNAHQIELAFRAGEGLCLSYNETKSLAELCFRPLAEIEAMGQRKIVLLTSAKAGKAPKDLADAVEPNTASKRMNQISQYLKFYREVFLDPNTRSSTLREQLKEEYEKAGHLLRTTISGTKQGHHHDIKSLPTDKYLAIIKAVFVRPDELFLNDSGKASRTVLRDRAMVLLACEGLRPGTLGNIARADFRQHSGHLVIIDNRAKRSERIKTGTPKLKMGDSTVVNNASETMIQLWPFTVRAVQDYIDHERSTVLMKTLRNKSDGFLFLNEKGESIKHRGSITRMFNRLGQQLAEQGLLDVGKDAYFANQKKYDFYGYVLRHSGATFYLVEKGTTDRVKDQMKVRFGWTKDSKMPERYAARAISDQANINLMEFNQGLLNAVKAKKQQAETKDGI